MARGVRETARQYRELVCFAIAGVGLVGYASVTPPAAGPEVFAWLKPLATMTGDFPQYAWRFCASFLLLGLLPLAGALAVGEKPRDLGLSWPRSVTTWWVWALVAVVSLGIAVAGAYTPVTAAYYPYSKSLLQRIAERGFGVFGLHAALYLLLYYLPWELLFRGILVFPVLRLAGNAEPSALICLASLQSVPSALLHFGHPPVESLGAVAFGVAAGYMTYRSRSILPALFIHAGVGIVQDLLLALRFVGALP
jgi:membrane protease YdiL (CAAX protease family)